MNLVPLTNSPPKGPELVQFEQSLQTAAKGTPKAAAAAAPNSGVTAAMVPKADGPKADEPNAGVPAAKATEKGKLTVTPPKLQAFGSSIL